jgi:hypothetical protein
MIALMYKSKIATAILISLFFISIQKAFNQTPPRDMFDLKFENNFNDDQLGKYTTSDLNADWNYPERAQREDQVDILTDGDAHGEYMRGYYPIGKIGAVESGWTWYTKLSGYTELYFSYDLRFKAGFEWVLGGKLPGLTGGEVFSGTEPSPTDGFSVRGMWAPDGTLVYYLYHQDRTSIYGDPILWPNFNFVSGQWYNITFRIVLNTVQNNVGDHNGILEGFINGKLIFQRTNINYRNYDNINIDFISNCSFFGGAEAAFNPIRDEWMDLDNFVAYTYNSNVIDIPRGQQASSFDKTLLIPNHDFSDYDWRNSFNTTYVNSYRVDLSWINYPVPANYSLERKKDGSPAFEAIASLNYGATTYSDTQIEPGATYTYRIIANNSASNEIVVPVPVPSVNVPIGLATSKVDMGSIVLNWEDQSDNETSFELERSGPNDNSIKKSYILDANTTTFKDIDVLLNSVYQYRIRAYNQEGSSPFSETIQVNSFHLDPPVAPTITIYKIDTASIVLNWNRQSGNETSFELECSGPNDNVFQESYILDASVTSYTDTAVLFNSVYQYRIRAFNQAGASPFSAPFLVNSFHIDPPVAPSLLESKDYTEKSITIRWNDNSSNESGFIIKRSQALDPKVSATIVVEPNDTSYVDDLLLPNTTYVYTVEAINKAGNARSNNHEAATLSIAETKRIKDGLVAYYNFGYSPFNIIRDLSGYGEPVDLKITQPSSVTWNESNRMIYNSNDALVSVTPATKIIDAIKKTNEITIETWIRPYETFSSADSRILSIGNNNSDVGVVLDQYFDANHDKSLNFGSRLRTKSTNESGLPELKPEAISTFLSLQHIVYTRDSVGNETMYLNGTKVAEGFRPNNLSTWSSNFFLRLGNESDQAHPWKGTFYMAAIYNKSLSHSEITRNFKVGPCDNLEKYGMNYDISIYPNPATDKTTINIKPEESLEVVPATYIRMQDISGRVYFVETMFNPNNEFTKEITLDKLAKGLYFIEVISGNQRKSAKLVIE